MEQHIREAINDELVKQAGLFYDVDFYEIKFHGGFESFVYIYTKNSVEYILRLVHSDHRIYEHVLGELEFIDYLAKNGACVSTVIQSKNGKIVEKLRINEKDYFSVSAFIKGLGDRVGDEQDKPEFWENLGLQIGLLHKLTKDFNPIHRRTAWEEETLYQIASKVLVGKDVVILDKLNKMIDKINRLQKNRNNYGLIHTDLHLGNMVIDNQGNLTFFDFDDAAYKHFISDIAIVVFYHFFFTDLSIELKNERTIWILNHFLRGYKKENHLEKAEFLHLQDFLKLRELTLYTVIVAGGPEVINSNWGKKFLAKYRDKIINEEPFIDLAYVLSKLEY
ncbi:phosphotransferase [Mycoplasmatota bacterium WC30]